jgi:hypothetical protein
LRRLWRYAAGRFHHAAMIRRNAPSYISADIRRAFSFSSGHWPAEVSRPPPSLRHADRVRRYVFHFFFISFHIALATPVGFGTGFASQLSASS